MGRAAKNVIYNATGKKKYSSGPSVTASSKRNLSPLSKPSDGGCEGKDCSPSAQKRERK